MLDLALRQDGIDQQLLDRIGPRRRSPVPRRHRRVTADLAQGTEGHVDGGCAEGRRLERHEPEALGRGRVHQHHGVLQEPVALGRGYVRDRRTTVARLVVPARQRLVDAARAVGHDRADEHEVEVVAALDELGVGPDRQVTVLVRVVRAEAHEERPCEHVRAQQGRRRHRRLLARQVLGPVRHGEDPAGLDGQLLARQLLLHVVGDRGHGVDLGEPGREADREASQSSGARW